MHFLECQCKSFMEIPHHFHSNQKTISGFLRVMIKNNSRVSKSVIVPWCCVPWDHFDFIETSSIPQSTLLGGAEIRKLLPRCRFTCTLSKGYPLIWETCFFRALDSSEKSNPNSHKLSNEFRQLSFRRACSVLVRQPSCSQRCRYSRILHPV